MFTWPVDTAISQVYGERDALKPGEYNIKSQNYPNGQNYHTGIDFAPDASNPQKPIHPIADGTIAEIYGLAGGDGYTETDESILLWDAGADLKFQTQESTCEYQNGVFVRIKPSLSLTPTGRKKYNPTGMTVVVKHANGKFSHYEHLSSVRKDLYESFDAWRKAGSDPATAIQVHPNDEIALMGSSGRNSMNGFALHLHLEVKNHAGPGHDPNAKQNAGPPVQYYGYVPGHPDLYGYTDPRDLIVPQQNVQFLSTVVKNDAGITANIRNAPGAIYDARNSTPTAIVATMGAAHEFFATKKVTLGGVDWYCVDLPSTNRSTYGKTLGWISSQVVQEVSGVPRLMVNGASTTGEILRLSASESSIALAGVFNGQSLVLAEPIPAVPDQEAWLKVFIPGRPAGMNNSQISPTTGWIRRAAVQVIGDGANLQCLAKDTGTPVAGATVTMGTTPVGTTDSAGRIQIPAIFSGTGVLNIVKDLLNFTGIIKVANAAEVPTVAVVEADNTGAPTSSSRFVIGDNVEVFGTGIGLRGRYPDPDSSTYLVQDDSTQGVVLDGPLVSGGYNRWKIHFDTLGMDLWCAEGEPDGSAFYLRKATAPAIDTLEPNNSSSSATPMTLGASIQSYVSSPSDVDWFKVTVTTPGQLTANLIVPAGLDYDLELYGPDGTWKAGSYNDAGVAESISYAATIAGTYYFRVYGYQIGNGSFSTTAPYTLQASFTNGSITVGGQPQDTSVPWGAAATFSVSSSNATGSAMAYQWMRNGVDIPGANSASYTTPQTQLGNSNDQYSARITSTYGIVTTSAATLTVTDPQSIYWTGAVSNDWNDSRNWDLNRVPNASDVVRVSSGNVVSRDPSGNIIIISTGAVLNWRNGTLNGTMTVASGGA
ncbi:MAG: pre-peptidase C-terminal domain-containing protein, partial [Verrucomicrobiota bacterium]